MNHIILFGSVSITIIRIYVDNYVVCFVVIDDNPDDLVMEVRRFLYNRQNRDKLIYK